MSRPIAYLILGILLACSPGTEPETESAVVPRAMAAAVDWPQWRGPARDAQAPQFSAPAAWPEKLTKIWSQPVGEGYASPVVEDGAVYIVSRRGDDEVVSRLDLSNGAIVWQQTYPAPYEPTSAAAPHGKGPKSTPLVAEGRLFTLGITGILSCFQAEDGKLLWRKDYSGKFDPAYPKFGASMSPIVYDGLLIAHVGNHSDGPLTAFNPADGSEIWQWQEDGAAYSSPVLVSVGGQDQLVTQSNAFVISVDPRSGKTLWKIPFATRFDQNSVTPVVFEDLLILGGYQERTFAVRVLRDGEVWKTEEVWSNAELPMYMSTPVAHGGLLYGFTQKQRGNLFCLDPRTGKELWAADGRQGDNALLVATSGAVLALTSEGRLFVLKPSRDKYEPLAGYEVSGSTTYAHPALLGDSILIKDAEAVTLWGF